MDTRKTQGRIPCEDGCWSRKNPRLRSVNQLERQGSRAYASVLPYDSPYVKQHFKKAHKTVTLKTVKGDERNGLTPSEMPNKQESITKPDSETENK